MSLCYPRMKEWTTSHFFTNERCNDQSIIYLFCNFSNLRTVNNELLRLKLSNLNKWNLEGVLGEKMNPETLSASVNHRINLSLSLSLSRFLILILSLAFSFSFSLFLISLSLSHLSLFLISLSLYHLSLSFSSLFLVLSHTHSFSLSLSFFKLFPLQ